MCIPVQWCPEGPSFGAAWKIKVESRRSRPFEARGQDAVTSIEDPDSVSLPNSDLKQQRNQSQKKCFHLLFFFFLNLDIMIIFLLWGMSEGLRMPRSSTFGLRILSPLPSLPPSECTIIGFSAGGIPFSTLNELATVNILSPASSRQTQITVAVQLGVTRKGFSVRIFERKNQRET